MKPLQRLQILTALTMAGMAALPAPSQAASLFLDSWGISYGSWALNASAPTNTGVFVEDYISGNNGFLGPGYGGQAYDVEAAYIGLDDNFFYLAVVTGFPLSGRPYGQDFYHPGDLALDLNADGSYEYAVDVDAGGALRSGNLVWENPAMNGDPAWGGVSDPLRVTSWTQSAASSAFSYAPWQGRYLIEARVDRDLIGQADNYLMHWTMGCGNDVANVAVAGLPAQPVPEPTTLILLGTGLGLARFARRRGNREPKS